MNVEEIMTGSPTCIAPDTTATEAARRMRDLDVGVLPICSEDRLVGMVTDRDLAVTIIADGRDPATTTVRDAMTPGVVYCFADDPIEVAARKMEDRQIRRLPVLDRDKRLVGIVSLGDIATRTEDDSLCGEVLERVSESSRSNH
jgi:CBS domain-containing protein